MTEKFRVGLTRDLLTSDGKPSFGAEPLQLLDDMASIEWEYLSNVCREISAEQASRYDALYIAGATVPASAVADPMIRVKLIARHGVGFDAVDVAAMTAHGVLVTNTPVAVRRPVATAALTLLLALAHKLLAKDRLTRGGRWVERTSHMGIGLTGRTFGIVGAGSIGKETLRLVHALDMRLLAADPYADAADLASLGARLISLDELLTEADFVCITCVLTRETRHLIDGRALQRMKPSAHLINVARGPIIDEAALIDALACGRIAGAALDVFAAEPIPADHPLLAMDNVIVTPHSLCWTDECFAAIAREGLASVVAVARRRPPETIVNPEAMAHPRLQDWFGY